MPSKEVKKVTIKGVEYELFYIHHLCFDLGRSAQTIRKWEIAGILPKTIFKDKYGRRLYTREQIDTIVRIAEECSIKQGASLSNTAFSRRTHKAFKLLNEKYLSKEGDKK